MRAAIAVALLAVLTGCGAEDTPTAEAAPATTTAAATLPDGRTPTPAQRAYLDDVLPQISEDKQADVLFVLSEGESVCTLWTHPSDPEQQQQAVNLFLSTPAGWTQTEAWAMVRAASEHFCPGQ